MRVGKDSGIFVTGKAETLPIEWLVDTGCTTTVLNVRTFQALHPDEQPQLSCFPGELISVDGSPIDVQGSAMMNIQIGSKFFQHRVMVADITNQGIIGMDFLQEHKMILDFAQGKLSCEGQEIRAYCRAGTHRACRVSVTEIRDPCWIQNCATRRSTKPLADGEVVNLWEPGNKPIMTAKC